MGRNGKKNGNGSKVKPITNSNYQYFDNQHDDNQTTVNNKEDEIKNEKNIAPGHVVKLSTDGSIDSGMDLSGSATGADAQSLASATTSLGSHDSGTSESRVPSAIAQEKYLAAEFSKLKAASSPPNKGGLSVHNLARMSYAEVRRMWFYVTCLMVFVPVFALFNLISKRRQYIEENGQLSWTLWMGFVVTFLSLIVVSNVIIRRYVGVDFLEDVQ